MQNNQLIDITPSPRVLRMLGQVDFQPWQCLAELIDNAVDAFLTERDSGDHAQFPQVNVEIPSLSDIQDGHGVIRVSDNAPGMDPKHLENAVRAGFSDNNPADKLGLFGMGFNVATARLGSRTEVWTTKSDSSMWQGIRIDFDEIEETKSFQTPLLLRPKTSVEHKRHGTEIVISKLDQQRVQYLRTPGGRRVTVDRLSRIYNKIMREIGLKIVVLDKPLPFRDFCIWDKSRSVVHHAKGRIPAWMAIERNFGDRHYCEDCWVWLLDREQVCPACGTTSNLILRTRKVSGWIGIQRFFDAENFGIDLIRNGRIIEERSKSFFSWIDEEEDQILLEYPIEQIHWGGRIVGELNIDFVPLASHQKDSFNRNSQEWRMVVEAVRGIGPILPRQRTSLGFPDENHSPLAKLHAGFRRGQPAGLRNLVPGDTKGKGFNIEPQQWAVQFWSGNPEYQSDEKWYQAVLTAESARQSGTEVPDDLSGDDLLSDGDTDVDNWENPEQSVDNGDTSVSNSVRETEVDPLLSLQVSLPELPGAPSVKVETQRLIKGSLASGLHLELAPTGQTFMLIYDPNHDFFTSTMSHPVDCLLEELGYQLLLRSHATQADWPLSRIAYELRKTVLCLDTEQCGRYES